MRKFTSLLIFLAIGTICVAAGISDSTTDTPKAVASDAQPQIDSGTTDLPGTIDGAKDPAKIPDHIAYSALFRMISNRQTAAEKNSIRGYVRQMGLGKQGNCPGCPPSVGIGDADIDAFIAAAEEFHQRVTVIDSEAATIKDSTWPNPPPDVMAHLAQLQQEKEAIATEIAASLSGRLSAEGMSRLINHMNEHVKRRVKLIPEPTTPPGGPGWHLNSPGRLSNHPH
jgi:hypothetical protein